MSILRFSAESQRLNTRQLARTLFGLLRLGAPIGASILCLWLLATTIEPGTLHQLPSALTALPAFSVLSALALTVVSFWAIGRYDAVAHRHFQTGIPLSQARRTGTLAVALSQTLGFGLFTGALVRWRMLPALSFGDAMRLSGFVCLSFLVAMGFVTALACLVFPAPTWTKLPALAVLIGLTGVLFASAFLPAMGILRRKGVVPSLRAFSAIGLWTMLDLVAAASVLFLLIPAADLSFAVFLPIFLLAYGAALLSSAPGGVGPFELATLALLPQVPVNELLGGILAYRILYYALPAMIAAAALLRPFSCKPLAQTSPAQGWMPSLPSEAKVIAQNGGSSAALDQVDVALLKTNQCLAVFSSSTSMTSPAAFDQLADKATAQNRIPLVYKSDALTASRARRAGWHVARIADEATVNPQTYTTQTPSRRGLRRKLRQAAKSGLRVELATALPLQDMAAIDHDWQARNGAARGTTMGRFCPIYLNAQQVFLAYLDDVLVGFASFHDGPRDWCLDLIRFDGRAPDGTVHMLVQHGLEHATRAGISQVSLAAAPACSTTLAGPKRALADWMMRRAGAAGLRQFKSAFAPDWHPRYAAAPSAPQLLLGLADMTLEIHSPAPLPASPHLASSQPHEDDEDYEVVLPLAS